MTTSPFGLVLWTTDIRGLAGFLVAACGASERALHPGYAELAVGPSTITLVDDEADRGHPWWNALSREGVARGVGAVLRFCVEDVEDAHSAAISLGGVTVLPPHDLEGLRECQVMGPDAFLFALWQPNDGSLPPLAGATAIRRDPFRSKPSLGNIIRRR